MYILRTLKQIVTVGIRFMILFCFHQSIFRYIYSYLHRCKLWITILYHENQMKSSFAKTDKRHPKIELFMPPCGLYFLVFNVKIFFGKNQQSPLCLPAKTYVISQKPISATFAGWLIQINPEMALVCFCKWTLQMSYWYETNDIGKSTS